MLINFNFVWKWILLNYYFNSIILRNFCIVWTMYWNKICFSKLFLILLPPTLPGIQSSPTLPHYWDSSELSFHSTPTWNSFAWLSNISRIQKEIVSWIFPSRHFYWNIFERSLLTVVRKRLSLPTQTSAYCHHFISSLEFPSFRVYNFLRKG